MKKILLVLFLLLSVVVLSEEKKDTFNPSNYIICIDPGHQTKGNNELEPIAPNSSLISPNAFSSVSVAII